MKGRKLQENTIYLFLDLLCSQQSSKVEPQDATENLEQFEYKEWY